MKIVGLTGGIGSGKTTVAKAFEALGIPIYIADDEAKKLMNRSKVIRRKLIQLFGEKTYLNNTLNRSFLAEVIFNDKEKLQQMNNIVHPRVRRHFEKWVLKQNAPYVIKEVAILFENNSYKQCDFVITVTADKDLRIKRLLKRDDTTKKKIKAIMDNQWSDAEKMKRSHYVIVNDALDSTKKQVHKIHHEILRKIQ
jgi:dephospho-CoA kinase